MDETIRQSQISAITLALLKSKHGAYNTHQNGMKIRSLSAPPRHLVTDVEQCDGGYGVLLGEERTAILMYPRGMHY
jgi:hypothetical protein